MGRYRPPPVKSSNHITLEGKQRLQKELRELWEVKRPKVTRAVSEAAAQGDRSENAEYIYGKKQLREIDARVRFLRKRLDQVIVVEGIPQDQQRVYFGAWVQVCEVCGQMQRFRIVGADEFDRHPDYISMDAPLARALLGRGLNDEVRVEVPAGQKTFVITGIRYDGEDCAL